MQAPSFALEHYIAGKRQPAATNTADELHTALNALQAAVKSATVALASLTATAEQFQEQALCNSVWTATTVHDTPASQEQGNQEEPMVQEAHSSDSSDGSHAVLQAQEVAILMDVAVQGMQRDLTWMVSEAHAGL